MRLVFFGTPSFAATLLEYLIEEKKHEIVGVVSKPDKPQGRDLKIVPTEVKRVHSKYLSQVPLFQPKRVSQDIVAEELSKLHADLFVVVAYGEIIKPNILSIPKFGCVNVHASLLPSYRGAAPMQRALMDGVETTGVTIMRMDEGLDSGDIICTSTIPVPEEMNMLELSLAMIEASKKALLDALDDIERGAAHFAPQDHAKMTLAPKLRPEELALNFLSTSAKTIHNKIRALSPKPGSYTHVMLRGETKRLKILKTRVLPKKIMPTHEVPQFILEEGNGIRVFFPNDPEYDLLIVRLQLEGKKEMDALEFTRGIDLSCFQLQ